MHQREVLDRIKSIYDDFQSGREEAVCGDLSDLIDKLELAVVQNEKITNIHATKKPILCVDFDGVIHSYKSGWKGVNVIPDPPNEGAIEWLKTVVDKFSLRIFSARCNDTAGIAAMIGWFRAFGLPDEVLGKLTFEAGKPSAYLIIDDRALRFKGDFAALSPAALFGFKPWYYAHPDWKR